MKVAAQAGQVCFAVEEVPLILHLYQEEVLLSRQIWCRFQEVLTRRLSQVDYQLSRRFYQILLVRHYF